MKKLKLLLLMLLFSVMSFGGNIYVDVSAGFNTLAFSTKSHDFTTRFGLGYNPDSALLAGLDFEYNPSSVILSSLHTTSDALLKSSGNISFGPVLKWSPLGTFYNQRDWKWFDIYVFAGAGMDYYRCSADEKFYGAYVRAGLEFDFNVKNASFFINADATEKMAASAANNKDGMSPNYMQQNLCVGFRYKINIYHADKSVHNINNIYLPQDSIVIYNNMCCDKQEAAAPIIIRDTVVKIVHDTITKDIEVSNLTSQNVLFANDKYDIRSTEVYKLNLVLETIQKHSELNIELVGMANKTGNATHNKWLSEQRCKSVKNWFIQQGIDANRIIETPMGDGASDGEGVDRCVVIKFSK